MQFAGGRGQDGVEIQNVEPRGLIGRKADHPGGSYAKRASEQREGSAGRARRALKPSPILPPGPGSGIAANRRDAAAPPGRRTGAFQGGLLLDLQARYLG